MLITAACKNVIVMANDSAVKNSFDDGHDEYETGVKHYQFRDIGCITMWGARVGNRLVEYLIQYDQAKIRTVADLAEVVKVYLSNNYQPHDGQLPDTGYHVAGFSSDGKPHVFHIFWNVAKPSPEVTPSELGTYWCQHFIPEPFFLLYNGRNDLVNGILGLIKSEIETNNNTRFCLDQDASLLSTLKFTHFCLRLGCELTSDIAPPFHFHILSPESIRDLPAIKHGMSVEAGFFEGILGQFHT